MPKYLENYEKKMQTGHEKDMTYIVIPRSNCCLCKIISEGDKKEGTNYYVCSLCDKPCDEVDISYMPINEFMLASMTSIQKYIKKRIG
jgi:hypothetical protein